MKKIIAIVLAVCVAVCTVLSAVCFAVFADDESTDTMTEREFEVSHLYVLNQFKNGEITFSEYQERSNALIDELYSDNTVGDVISSSAQKVGSTFQGITNKIGAVAETYGEAAYQYVADWINDFLDDYNVTTTTTNFNLNGYGAAMWVDNCFNGLGGSQYCYDTVYCDYIIVKFNSDGSIYSYNGYTNEGNQSYRIIEVYYYSSPDYSYFGSNHIHSYYESQINAIKLYGDVRYEDGTAYEGLLRTE